MTAVLTSSQIEELILGALNDVNEEQPEDERIEVGPHTPLFGPNAQIDSLALVSVIVDVETALNVDHDLPISLTDDRAMTREISPFDDVQTLKDYIVELVAEHA
jgi:acyl carrier protein